MAPTEQQLATYGQARQAFLNAQGNPAQMDTAGRTLRQAEIPVAAELAAAWDANVDAIQTAKATLVEVMREQARIEVECGNAARTRNPSFPVLTGDEITQVTAAAQASDDARAALVVAEQAFKAGVTAEQLEAVT